VRPNLDLAKFRVYSVLIDMENLIRLDADLSRRMRLDDSHGSLRRLAIFFAHSGDSWFWAAGLGLVWLFNRGEWRSSSALLLLGVIGLAVLVLAIKFLIRRRRPEGEWGAIYRNTDPHSFPSGHAARAFLLATLALALGPAWFGGLLLVWAPLVCLARVSMGVHYMSDVVAGMLLGILAGFSLLALAPTLLALFPFLF
jgi:membrane-associated phospholipid phosphatase